MGRTTVSKQGCSVLEYMHMSISSSLYVSCQIWSKHLPVAITLVNGVNGHECLHNEDMESFGKIIK